MCLTRLWFSLIRIIPSVLLNIYFSIYVLPSMFLPGCSYDDGNAFELKAVCVQGTSDIIVTLANIPHYILQPFAEMLSGYLSVFYVAFYMGFLFLNALGLFTFVIIAIIDFIVIRNHDVRMSPRIGVLLCSEVILVFFGIVALLSWFIPEIPNIIS